MKITPVSTQGMTVGSTEGGAAVSAVRAMQMKTNATPGRAEYPPADPNLPIPVNSDDPSKEADEEITQPLSPQLAAIAKQRRALQVKEREIADREKALEGRTPTQGDAVDIARLKSDPLRVLEEAGVTYEQLTDAILSNQGQGSSEIRELKAQLKALEEGVDKKLTDRDAHAEKQVLAEMQREAGQLIAEGDDYEMVRETKSLPEVMTLIEKTYRETGEVLQVAEALRLVEEELVNESLKIARINKVQSRLAPPPVLEPTQRHRQMRTLTNRDTATVPMSAKARAIAAFHGTLKR